MSYSNDNKQTRSGLCKRYSYTADLVKFKYGQETEASIHTVYCVTRVVTKSYSYNGLSEADAKTCASDKLTKYTNYKKGWYFDKETGFHYEDSAILNAQVAPIHDQGHLWHCDIQVNEKQVEYVIDHLPANLSSLFTDLTDYDE